MKTSIYLLFAFLLLHSCVSNESVFKLDPTQSMLITGKGEGQDAAINPYSDQKSRAVVKNLGHNPLEVRIQSKGTFIKQISISPKETKEFILEKDYELYLDSNLATKARVDFEKYND